MKWIFRFARLVFQAAGIDDGRARKANKGVVISLANNKNAEEKVALTWLNKIKHVVLLIHTSYYTYNSYWLNHVETINKKDIYGLELTIFKVFN